MCEERKQKEMKTILRVLCLGNKEGGDSLIETGKFKKREGFREEMINFVQKDFGVSTGSPCRYSQQAGGNVE